MAFGDIVILGYYIKQIVADDAALFLWTTSPFLEKSFEVIRAWGFTYRTMAFVWTKVNEDGSPFIGTGYYTRANAEYCLLGVRGSMPVKPSDRPPQMIIEPVREHSRKPDCLYRRIRQMYRFRRGLELFASKYSAPLAYHHGLKPVGYDVNDQSVGKFLRSAAQSN